jgi:two-component system NarL family response regulator
LWGSQFNVKEEPMSELFYCSRPPDRAGAAAPLKRRVNVVIAHADAIVSAGLASLLEGHADLYVTIATGGTAASDAGADVIICDHRSAMAYTRRWAGGHRRPALPQVLIVTQLDREWDVHSAMMAGVHGYLLQNAGARQLLAAVRTLSRGMHYLSAELRHCMAASTTRTGLTSRETDVLQLLAQGMCNKAIARELDIGVGTVKTHVKGLFEKLGATARTHAVVLAMERGLVGRDYAAEP